MSSTPGRNERCPCKSGRKYKVCCGAGRTTATARAGPGPSEAMTHALRAARGYLDAGRYADAIAPLLQAASLAPEEFGVLHQLGVTYLFAHRPAQAITWLQRAIAQRPAVASVHFDLGLAFAQSNDDERAVAAFQQATALEPSHVDAHAQLGDLLRQMNRAGEAAAAYESAFRSAPGTARGLLCHGKALLALDRPREAEECFKQTIVVFAREARHARAAPSETDAGCHAEAQLALGHLLVEAGRFEEATPCFERSIELAPWQTTAHHELVATKRLKEDDRPLLDRILRRLESPELTERQRMTLHFAAGKALDDLRDYRGAIEQFDAANRVRRAIVPFQRGPFERRVDATIARFTADFFAENARLGADDDTPVLVLGMPRSGTTLVERFLSSHPGVGGGGELTFWSSKVLSCIDASTEELAARADGLRAEYLAVLRGVAPSALRVTDKLPFNFLWLGLVHVLLPKARIVHCRRNPVDTCLSIYFTYFSRPWAFASDRGDLAFYYRQYARLMEHWRAVLPADRLIDVDYEQATAAPEETARRLIAFAGLPWDPACLRPDRNAAAVRTASNWQARQPIYRSSVERWRNYEPWLGDLRELIPAR